MSEKKTASSATAPHATVAHMRKVEHRVTELEERVQKLEASLGMPLPTVDEAA